MKKNLAMILVCLLVVSLLAGCAGDIVIVGNNCTCPTGSHTETTPNGSTNETTKPTEGNNDNVTAGAVKTGLAVFTSVKDSTSATADAEGSIKYDITIAAVTVDANGVITACAIDSVPATVTIDATGAITSDLTATIATKNELGENYGMVAWGGAIAEWNEQAAAFASYVTGKTAAEVAGISITETTKPADDTDLATSVTIAIGDFMGLIAKALG